MRSASAWLVFIIVLATATGCKRGNRDDAPARDGGGEGNKKDKLAQNPPKPPPPNADGGAQPVKKGPQSFLGTLHARGERVALDNEMKQIAIFFNAFCIDHPNPGTRKVEDFLNSIKRDSYKIHEGIKTERFYTMNMKARLGTDDILAYETQMYSDGYYCIRATGQLGLVSQKEWQAALGIP